MWDIESGETRWTASIASNFAVASALQGRSSGLVFTPDGSGFFVPGFILSPAHPFWDARTAQEQLPKLKFEETRMVLMTSDTFPGRPLGYFPRSFTIRFSAAAFSPDGNRLLTWMDRPYGIPDVLRLWDLRTRTVLWKSKLTLVKAAAFSPDGARIAVIPDNLWGYPSR